MSSFPGVLLHVVLSLGARRSDVAVSSDALVGDVLRASGVDVAAVRVVDSTGVDFDLDLTIGEQMNAGEVLWVLDAEPRRDDDGASRTGAPAQAIPAGRRRTVPGSAGWLAGLLALVLCAVLVLTHTMAMSSGLSQLPDVVRYVVAALVGSGAVLLALARRGDPGGRDVADSHLLDETIFAPVLGFAAGFLLVPTAMVGADRTAVYIGLVVAACLAGLRYAVSRRVGDPSDSVAAVLATIWVALAVLFALALLAGVPGHVAPTLVLGAVPLVIRALPSASIDVPDDQLLDLPLVTRTASSVRGRSPRSPGRVQWRQVDRAVRFAERRKSAGLIAVSVLVVLMAPWVFTVYEPRTLSGWATLALLAFLAIALGLGPRVSRGTPAKVAPRLALVGLLVEVALVARGTSTQPWALALVVVAVGLVLLSLAIVRGWRSVAWSRAGDVLEGIAVVLIMPAALIAAGAVQGLQLLTAG